MDYRTAPKTKGEESGSAIRSLGNNSPMMAPPSSFVKKTNSPQKSNASKREIRSSLFPACYSFAAIAGSSSDSTDRVDGSQRYDPSDMVIDMDMSDEDLDESQRGNST